MGILNMLNRKHCEVLVLQSGGCTQSTELFVLLATVGQKGKFVQLAEESVLKSHRLHWTARKKHPLDYLQGLFLVP